MRENLFSISFASYPPVSCSLLPLTPRRPPVPLYTPPVLLPSGRRTLSVKTRQDIQKDLIVAGDSFPVFCVALMWCAVNVERTQVLVSLNMRLLQLNPLPNS